MKNKLLTLLTAVIAFLMQNVIFGQAPNLGTTSSFALFTAGGAFSNIGNATIVTGDVGTHVGAFTAFPPGTLVGQKHWLDPTSTSAATDVLAAYNYLSTLGGTVLGVTLGSGQHLTQGVYNTGAASTLNGTLTLDGEGDPNALFIIRIGGAFSTGTNSNVVLTNSASLCNVYWQINGQFDLGDGSVFRGTLIADGAIHLLEGSTLLGRGLSTAGAIELHNNVVTNSCACLVAAPTTTLTQPTCLVATGTITVTAPTGTGMTYSIDGSTYTNTTGIFTLVPAGTYTVTEKNSDGCISSGTSVTINAAEYSEGCISPGTIVTITNYVAGIDEIIVNSKIGIYPDPNDGQFTVVIDNQTEKHFDILIHNAMGSKIYEEKNIIVKGKLEHKIDIAQAPRGMYYVIFRSKDELIISKIIIL